MGTKAIQWTVGVRVHCYYCGCRLSGIVVANTSNILIIYKAFVQLLLYGYTFCSATGVGSCQQMC